MNETLLRSKVLVLDNTPEFSEEIKSFFDHIGLLPLKVSKTSLLSVLSSNIDLGAVFFAENYGDSAEESMEIAKSIHMARRELPILLRREDKASLDDLPVSVQRYFCAAYVGKDLGHLRTLVDDYIFCLVYPSALVRGIKELTESVLTSQFKGMKLHADVPYVVRDRLIYGEVFSLMALESAWCKGYMMFQAQEAPLLQCVKAMASDEEADFRSVNSFLGEITNLVWGQFKNRYVGEPTENENKVQVPLIINHQHKYISFGTDNPQLCLHYTLTNETTGLSFEIYQRFIFNLSWSPEDFKEISTDIDDLVSSGELEFF